MEAIALGLMEPTGLVASFGLGRWVLQGGLSEAVLDSFGVSRYANGSCFYWAQSLIMYGGCAY